MGAVLAAAVGSPDGGYAYAQGAIACYGRRDNAVPMPPAFTEPQRREPDLGTRIGNPWRGALVARLQQNSSTAL
jgi:hypothetical protein